MSIRTNQHGKLMIDFTCSGPGGDPLRCRESTGLQDTKQNRKIVSDKDRAVRYELQRGSFDYLHFFPTGAKASIFRGTTIDIPTMAEWWDIWIGEKTLRWTTERGWNSSYAVHIGPHFGHYPIDQITDHEIRVFRKKLLSGGLKASTINDKIIKPLCMCLLRAYDTAIITGYACKGIRKLSEEPVDIQPFTYEELTHLLETVRIKAREYYNMLYIWSRTGLRPGEVYALKWEHVDYFNSRLLVRQTRTAIGDGPTKTATSTRDIILRPSTIAAFRDQEARTGLIGGYVFLTQADRPFSDAFMRKKFAHILRLAGLSYRPPKQMRHTFATLALAAGENISWVSKTLGHASAETTWKRYNRFVPNLTRDDGSALDDFLATVAKQEVKTGKTRQKTG